MKRSNADRGLDYNRYAIKNPIREQELQVAADKYAIGDHVVKTEICITGEGQKITKKYNCTIIQKTQSGLALKKNIRNGVFIPAFVSYIDLVLDESSLKKLE